MTHKAVREEKSSDLILIDLVVIANEDSVFDQSLDDDLFCGTISHSIDRTKTETQRKRIKPARRWRSTQLTPGFIAFNTALLARRTVS